MGEDSYLRVHDLVAKHARSTPDNVAVVDTDGREYTYSQFQNAINEAATILQAHGAQSSDRILLVAENCVSAAAFIFAASSIKACIVPVNARMTSSEIGKVQEHASVRLTIFTTGVSENAQDHAVRAQATTLESGFGTFAIVGSTPVATVASMPEEVEGETAVILYTTGTTGAPKGVMLTHANLRFAARTSSELRGLLPGDRVYGVLPLTHVFGLASMLMASCYTGASVQLEARFRPQDVYAALLNGVSVFPGVPQMHALVMQYAREQGLSRLENSHLRYVSSGAAPLDPAWKRKAEEFYGVALQNGYGMTESTAGICATSNTIGSSDTSVGPALSGVEIRLDTRIGGQDEVAQGGAVTGEVLTRGPHVMKGYFNNPEQTAQVIDSHGWLSTGDLGRIDESGNLHIVGRCKELIIRGGFNVYPPEVEAALNDHPDVIQCAVVGRTLGNADEEILAFVQCPDPDAIDVSQLAAFVSERLASYKRPSQIIVTTELPAAATGKVLKHKLLATFSDQVV